MIKTKLLQELLNLKGSEIKKLKTDQLRTTLGVFRYLVRRLEREVNERCSDDPIGKVSELQINNDNTKKE